VTDIGWWRWNGAMLLPTRLEAVERMFEVDGRYHLESHFERSAPRHRAYFASLAEAWHSLPESTRDELPSPEHLRHFSLIKTGWRNERHIVLGSHREAIRVAAFMARPETFAVIFPDGHRVVEWTAKSQSYRAMDREAFNRSMDDVMRYVAGLIGVSQEELEEQGASA
jgi:hypothetical protein